MKKALLTLTVALLLHIPAIVMAGSCQVTFVLTNAGKYPIHVGMLKATPEGGKTVKKITSHILTSGVTVNVPVKIKKTSHHCKAKWTFVVAMQCRKDTSGPVIGVMKKVVIRYTKSRKLFSAHIDLNRKWKSCG
mgnify:CR=1 FL=1